MDSVEDGDYNKCKIMRQNFTENISGWEGIPEAVVLNALIATCALFTLSVIRAIYFKRKPYQNDWNVDWLQFIYSDRSVETLHYESPINRLHPNAYLPSCLQPFANLVDSKKQMRDMETESSLYITSNMCNRMKDRHRNKLETIGTYRHWLLDYILIKDQDIYEHRGNDAFQYLLFQRYIIYFLTALTAVCIIILMPINIYGKTGEKNYFEMTTINNISEASSIFWIHTIIAIAMVILGVLMMKNFSDLIFSPNVKEFDDRTILIRNIPETKRNPVLLKAFIEKKFVGVEITRITFSYNIENLKWLTNQLITIQSATDYCAKYRDEYGFSLEVSPYVGGRFCSLCPKIDGLTYYRSQRKNYVTLVKDEVARLMADPKNSVFVQLRNKLMAQRILLHFENTKKERLLKRIFQCLQNSTPCYFTNDCRLKRNVQTKRETESDRFQYNLWNATAAPFPEDIEWKDLTMSHHTTGLCKLILTILSFFIFLFLTTPLVVLNFLKEIIFMLRVGKKLDEFSNNVFDLKIGDFNIRLAKYISPILMNLISIILPNLIILIQLFVPQTTKSEKNHKVMKNVYLYLILMVVIFPSLGLVSGRYFLKRIIESEQLPKYIYKCLFPAESSLFFVHYLISCIFLNNSFQLLRLPELGIYFLNCLIYPRTEAEYAKARIETHFEFSYGSNYPRFLLIFTIATTYSIACPIIAPFGLLYMLFKHLVDRYSIYYLYSTPVISPNIHQTAITFVLISYFFLLLQLTAFLNTRNEYKFQFKPSSVCTVALILYIIIIVCFTFFNFNGFYGQRNGKRKSIRVQRNPNQATLNSTDTTTVGQTTITNSRSTSQSKQIPTKHYPNLKQATANSLKAVIVNNKTNQPVLAKQPRATIVPTNAPTSNHPKFSTKATKELGQTTTTITSQQRSQPLPPKSPKKLKAMMKSKTNSDSFLSLSKQNASVSASNNTTAVFKQPSQNSILECQPNKLSLKKASAVAQAKNVKDGDLPKNLKQQLENVGKVINEK